MRTLGQLDSAANQQREDNVRLRVGIVAQTPQALRERRPLAPVRLPEHIEEVHDGELSLHRNVSQHALGAEAIFDQRTREPPSCLRMMAESFSMF